MTHVDEDCGDGDQDEERLLPEQQRCQEQQREPPGVPPAGLTCHPDSQTDHQGQEELQRERLQR